MNLGSRQERGPSPDLDLRQLIVIFWGRRMLIAACVLVALIGAVLYTVFATPVYRAQSVIALRDNQKPADARLLSQIGGIGGGVAAQLGMGNANLDRLEVILKGHELAEQVITRHDLMPLLFPRDWDSSRGAWKAENPKKRPTLRSGIDLLRTDILEISLEQKKNLIRVGVGFWDPVMARRIVEFYLAELNNRIRNEIIEDSKANRAYLERQLGDAFDPVLIEKIKNMIAYEIERTMLVSSKTFDVLERPVTPIERSSPRPLRVLVVSVFLGLFVAVLGILGARAFSSLKATLSESGK